MVLIMIIVIAVTIVTIVILVIIVLIMIIVIAVIVATIVILVLIVTIGEASSLNRPKISGREDHQVRNAAVESLSEVAEGFRASGIAFRARDWELESNIWRCRI